uniref:Coiled-coil domain containing 38 n=1 Tax=Cebus imitator TaxID=2715852 RepID=A0A2K5QFJ1_CEBIM
MSSNILPTLNSGGK